MENIDYSAQRHAHIDAPGVILADLLNAGSGHVYDVLDKKIVLSDHAGLLDPVRVARVALEIASSGVALAISTDTMILHREPEVAQLP